MVSLGLKTYAYGIAAGVLLAAAVGLLTYVNHLRATRDKALIAAHDLRADRDQLAVLRETEGKLLMGKLAAYGDSVRALRADVKKAEVVAHFAIAPKAVTIEVHDTVLSRRGLLTGPLELSHAVSGPPVDVATTVTIAPSEDSSRIIASWHQEIKPWSIPITIDVGCRGKFEPDILIETPDWAAPDQRASVHTRLAPNLCGAPASTGGKTLSTLGKVALAAGGFALGWVAHR